MILPFSTSRSRTSLISNCLYWASLTPRTMFSKSMNIASFRSSLMRSILPATGCLASVLRDGPMPALSPIIIIRVAPEIGMLLAPRRFHRGVTSNGTWSSKLPGGGGDARDPEGRPGGGYRAGGRGRAAGGARRDRRPTRGGRATRARDHGRAVDQQPAAVARGPAGPGGAGGVLDLRLIQLQERDPAVAGLARQVRRARTDDRGRALSRVLLGEAAGQGDAGDPGAGCALPGRAGQRFRDLAALPELGV